MLSLSLVSNPGFTFSCSKHLRCFPGSLTVDGTQRTFGSFLMCPFHTATDACSSETMFIQVGFLQLRFIHTHEQESPLFREDHGGFSKKSELGLSGINKQETQRVGAWLPVRAFETAALALLSHQGRGCEKPVPTNPHCTSVQPMNREAPSDRGSPAGGTSARPAPWWPPLSLTHPSNCCYCPRSKWHNFTHMQTPTTNVP